MTNTEHEINYILLRLLKDYVNLCKRSKRLKGE